MRHHIIRISAAAAVCGALLLLQGCGAAVKQCIDPQLDIPETILPGGYADSLCLADLEWSEIFSDPLLKDLIEKTLENNKDMLAAASRVRELERLHRVTRADQFPSFRARANMEQENYQYTGADPVKDNEFGMKAAVSWEIDLFGKPELNLINAIIRERPCEILLRGASLSAPMNSTLRHIARVVVEQG